MQTCMVIIKPCLPVHTTYQCCIFEMLRAPLQVHCLQHCKAAIYHCVASSLKVLWYLVWNGKWKKILVRNGKFLVWNEEHCQHGIWKNHLPFHSTPFPAHQIDIAYILHRPSSFT